MKYEAANILYKINNSVADRIEENLEKYADKLKIPYVIVIGEDEIKNKGPLPGLMTGLEKIE